ncbi:MAG: Gfo/Idh/MocA family oxidoreductase [Polyangiaceae bacterium]|jgi:predicted dehydrogenase
MRLAIVGCGFVADFYAKTLTNHPELELVGVFDRDAPRSRRYAALNGVREYASLDELLRDRSTEIVVNLTNPASHYAVSKAALDAGKHVYSEKPLSTTFSEAEQLVEIAERRGLELASAPCSVLGESAQTLWKALRDKRIGTVRLAYAELDDGPIHLMGYKKWRSDSGTPWPYKDEFEVGCTLEHAGYYVTWLAAFFGPARAVTSFAALTVPDKGVPLERQTEDFTVACIEFPEGVVARVTCSIFGSHDHRLRVFGDLGVLSVDDCWDYGSPVRFQKRTMIGIKAEKYPRAAEILGLGPRKVPMIRKPSFAFRTRGGGNRMDFARGIAEMAAAIQEKRASRMSARFGLHVNEIVLAIQNPRQMGSPRQLVTSFAPIAPTAWAR